MAKTKIAERQTARILKAITTEALTNQQLAARLHMSIDSTRRFLHDLMDEKPRRLHISKYVNASNRKALACYIAGAGKDAKYVPVRKRPANDPRRAAADRKRAEVLRLLALPQTSDQLAARTGISGSYVDMLLREHRQATPKRVYIKAWLPPLVRGSHTPVYAAGDKPDAPRVRMAPLRVRRVERAPAGGLASMLSQLM